MSEGANWIQVAQERVECRTFQHDSEPSVFLKGGEFIEKLIDYQPHKKDTPPWSVLAFGTREVFQ
jgi:hypothetical protein